MVASRFPVEDVPAAALTVGIVTMLQVVAASAVVFAGWCGRQS